MSNHEEHRNLGGRRAVLDCDDRRFHSISNMVRSASSPVLVCVYPQVCMVRINLDVLIFRFVHVDRRVDNPTGNVHRTTFA